MHKSLNQEAPVILAEEWSIHTLVLVDTLVQRTDVHTDHAGMLSERSDMTKIFSSHIISNTK